MSAERAASQALCGRAEDSQVPHLLTLGRIFLVERALRSCKGLLRGCLGAVGYALCIMHYAHLIFVIFFTQAKFLENKIYTEKTRKLRQNTQKIANFLRYYGKLHSKLPIFRVKSVKIYTGQKKFKWVYPWYP